MFEREQRPQGCNAGACWPGGTYTITINTQGAINGVCGRSVALRGHCSTIVEAVCVDVASSETKSALLMDTTPSDNPAAPTCTPSSATEHTPRGGSFRGLGLRVKASRPSFSARQSTTCTAWCKLAAHDCNGRIHTTQFGVAKPRFEPCPKPLVQMAPTFPAAARVAYEICVFRAGTDEARHAQRFLDGAQRGEGVVVGHVGGCCERGLGRHKVLRQ